MAKLFALEEAEVTSNDIELETAPEAGEIADVHVDIESDVNEMQEISSGVEEGIDAADQLEDVQEVVEKAAENGGLDPVAAEAVKIAVEAICARVGANPKSVYALYATENFTSASSRRANTKYALEGIGEFLKNLWERIKATLSSLWNKIAEFWQNNMTKLGRSMRSLESMKKKVLELNGVPATEEIDAPSNVKSIFPTSSVLTVKEIGKYKTTLEKAKKKLFKNFEILNSAVQVSNLDEIKRTIINNVKNSVTIVYGSETDPMPGGTYYSCKFQFNVEQNREGLDVYSLKPEENSGEYKGANKNARMVVANKEDLKDLIEDGIRLCSELVENNKQAKSRGEQAKKVFKEIDKQIDAIQDEKEKKQAQNDLKAFKIIMDKAPVVEAKFMSYAYLYFRGIVNYANVCIKNTKTA